MTPRRYDPEWLVVGRITRPHGVRGELRMRPLSDRADRLFVEGAEFRLSPVERTQVARGSDREAHPDPEAPVLHLEGVRGGGEEWIVAFGEIDDRTAAEGCSGRSVLARVADLPPLEPDEFFLHELLGMRVRTPEGLELGSVSELFDLGPSLLLEVKGPRGTLLVPWNEDLLVEMRREEGVLVLAPPEGLLDLQG